MGRLKCSLYMFHVIAILPLFPAYFKMHAYLRFMHILKWCTKDVELELSKLHVWFFFVIVTFIKSGI